MSNGIKVSLQMLGGEQLRAKLNTFSTKVHNKIVRQAVRVAGKPVLKRAKANAKSMVGGKMGQELASHLVLRKQAKKLPKFVFALNILFKIQSMVDSLIYHPLRKGGKKVFLPAAIEYGHGADKDAAAIPFMRQAFRQSQAEAQKILASELKKGIESEGRK